MSAPCQQCIPPLDFNPDNPFVVNVPDSFVLPQDNPYAADLTVEQITLLTAAFLAMAGITLTAGQLETNAETFSCLPQVSQIPAALWLINQILVNIEPATGGGVYAGNYGSAKPQLTPLSQAALAIDSVTKRQWQYVAGKGWN